MSAGSAFAPIRPRRYACCIDRDHTLLERARLIDALRAHLTAARGGSGAMVLIGGEAGIGKTSLVMRFCSDVQSEVRVLMGACDALDTPRPLGPLFDLRRDVGTRFSEALAAGERDQAFDILIDELARRPQRIAVIQDVHWADAATLDLLRYLGRRIAGTPALVIATYRDDEVGARHPLRAVLGDLATSTAVHRLTVPALSQAAVAELARGFAIDPYELHRVTGGNPFFVTEVLAAGRSDVPQTVRDAVTARASRLSDGARRALDVASVVGAEVDVELLAALGVNHDDLESLLDAGILRDHGRGIAFRHELVRDAVQRALSAPQRTDLHRRVLTALSGTGGVQSDPAVMAYHAAEAGAPQAVLRFAIEAARRATALRAHREARSQYARAYPFLGDLPAERRADILDAYATECTIVDDFAEGSQVRREAISLWRRLGRDEHVGLGLSLLAQAEHGLGRGDEASSSNDESIRVLEPLGPSRELARALWYGAVLRRWAGDTRGVVDLGTRSIGVCRSLGELPLLANAHNVVGGALLADGVEEGRAHVARSLAIGRELGLPDLIADVHASTGDAAVEARRFDDAVQELRAAIQLAIDHNHDNIRYAALASLSLALLYQGAWSEAADAALAVQARPQVAAYSKIKALIALGRLRARRGDPDAIEVLDDALALAAHSGSPLRTLQVHVARLEAATMLGDLARARAEAESARPWVEAPGRPWLVGELCHALSRHELLDELPNDVAEPFALQLVGRAEAAAEAWDDLGCPYEAARARSESNDPSIVREALEAFIALGAGPAAFATTRRLRELGVRGVPRGPRRATLDHPARLTPRESQVLALLAEGLRNREIAARHVVSTRTVDHQVSSVLAKLGVRTRTEAVAEAHRLGLLPQHGHHEEQA